MGLKGIMTASLTGRVKTDTPFAQNTTVTVTFDSWTNIPTFYIDNSSFDGVCVQFTAYDATKKLDKPFSRANYTEMTGNTENQYQISAIFSDLCGQCGLISGYSPSNRSTLTYNDLDGTCRQIVEKLSEMECGTFRISSGTTLAMLSAVSTAGGITLYDDEYSETIEQSNRLISGLVITDTHNNVTYQYGSTDYHNVSILSGDYIDQSASQSIASALLNSGQGYKRYYAFVIQNAILHDFAKAGSTITLGLTDPVYLPYRADSITIRFGAVYAIAALSAPMVFEGYAAYMNAMSRKDKDSLKSNSTYGIMFVDKTNGNGYRVK